MYIAPSTTPVTATEASIKGTLSPSRCAGHAAVNAPMSARNSPVKPLVVGNPTEASVKIMKNTEYTGSTRAKPPYAASSRVWQRS